MRERQRRADVHSSPCRDARDGNDDKTRLRAAPRVAKVQDGQGKHGKDEGNAERKLHREGN